MRARGRRRRSAVTKLMAGAAGSSGTPKWDSPDTSCLGDRLMSRIRDLIVTAAFIIAVAIIAVPPWTGHGYALLWNPPGQEATVDFSRLLLAGVATAAAASILVFMAGRTAARPRV